MAIEFQTDTFHFSWTQTLVTVIFSASLRSNKNDPCRLSFKAMYVKNKPRMHTTLSKFPITLPINLKSPPSFIITTLQNLIIFKLNEMLARLESLSVNIYYDFLCPSTKLQLGAFYEKELCIKNMNEFTLLIFLTLF